MTCGKVNSHLLSQLFTAGTFRKVVGEGDFDPFLQLVHKNAEYLQINEGSTNLDVIKKAYKHLDSNYRNEYFYKNVLFNSLIAERKLKNTVVLNELRINQSIADTVCLNGQAVLYEIKTELDTPEKLESQLRDYRKAFTKIFVVSHHSNYYKYYQFIKGEGIGLIVLDENSKLVEHTPAIENGSYLEHAVLFKLLRKSEYTSLIKDWFGFVPEVPNTLYFKKSLELTKNIPIDDFQKLVVIELKRRLPKEYKVGNIQNVPKELRYICHMLNMKEEQYINLSKFLHFTFKI